MESRKSCSDAIKIDDEPRLYCDRAEAYLLEDMFDEVSFDCEFLHPFKSSLFIMFSGHQRLQRSYGER